MENQWVVVAIAFVFCLSARSVINGAEKLEKDKRKKIIEDKQKKISDRFRWM